MKFSEKKAAVLEALNSYLSQGNKLTDNDLFAFHPSYTGTYWKNKATKIPLKKAA